MKLFQNEKVKTLILTLLVFCSMILTYRLWFRDHNLFSILENFVQSKKIVSSNSFEYVYLHSKILVNYGDNSHTIVTPVQEEFTGFQKEGNSILKVALKSQKVDITDFEEWNKVLSSKSLLFGYETDMPTDLLLKIFNMSNQNGIGNIKYIKDIIVVIDDTVSDNVKCYIKSDKQDTIFIIRFSYDDSTLNKLVNRLENKEYNNYITGYEIKNKLLKDDVLILPADAIMYGTKVKLTNEFNLSSSNDIKNVAQKIFPKYNIVKHVDYLDSSKTNVTMKEFIDRNNILKLYDDGRLEYSTSDIPTNIVQTDVFGGLKTVVGFVQDNLGFPKDSYLSEIKQTDNSHYIFSFDYSINGLKVKIKGDVGNPNHAITVEVLGDKIINYKRNVKNFKLESPKELNVLNLKALDEALAMYRLQFGNKNIEKAINDIQLVYTYDTNKQEIFPDWYVMIDNQEFFVKSVDEEN